MKPSKLALILGLALLYGLIISTRVSADTPGTNDIQWLFVQDAASGSLEGVDLKNLRLTLKRIGPVIAAFSDRPQRLAMAIPNQTFFNGWNAFFANASPNATLNYRKTGDIRPRNIVLELSSPLYDSKKQTVTFKAVVIYSKLQPMNSQVTDVPIAIPRTFLASSLFIDGTSVHEYCSQVPPSSPDYATCQSLLHPHPP